MEEKIMTYKKLFLSILLAICLCLEIPYLPISAQETSAFGYTQTDINQMNDKEFLDYVNSAITDSSSFEQAQNTLSLVGVTITNENPISTNFTSRSSQSSDVSFLLYSSHRSGQSYYYLTASITAKKNLASDSGTEDIISVEWNPNQANYYSFSEGKNTTYMDGSKRSKGILLFNLQDSKLYKGKSAYCSALVKPKKGKKTISYASKYVHTYTKTKYNWSIGSNVSYSSKDGYAGGLTFNISGSAKKHSWQRYFDNDLYLK